MNLPAAVRAFAVLQLALCPEALAGGAVFPLIGSFVNVALFIHLLEYALDRFNMIVISGPYETVVGDIHQLPEVQYAVFTGDYPVYKFLGADPGLPGLFLNLLTMLVGTGKEHHIIAAKPLISCNSVGGHGAVGMAYMQLVGGVIDRRCDVKGVFLHFSFLLSLS